MGKKKQDLEYHERMLSESFYLCSMRERSCHSKYFEENELNLWKVGMCTICPPERLGLLCYPSSDHDSSCSDIERRPSILKQLAPNPES